MPQLRFYHGLMGVGKSTLALQFAHSYRQAGRVVVCITGPSREPGVIKSRLGVEVCAYEFDEHTIFGELYRGIDNRFVIDEAQFLTEEQVEYLYDLTEATGIDVDCFGLKTDFRSKLFPGSQRLIEIADEVIEIVTPVLCPCGQIGQVNARLVGGLVTRFGPQILVGDTGAEYQVLCYPCWLASPQREAA